MFPLWSIWDVPSAFAKCFNDFILDKNLMILMMKLWLEDNCYDDETVV